MRHILVFYVTHPSEAHANRMVTELIDLHLIACGNVFPMTSEYIWKTERCLEDEFVSILKTRIGLEEKVEERILELHEYDTPCIIRTDFRCNQGYANWIEEQTK